MLNITFNPKTNKMSQTSDELKLSKHKSTTYNLKTHINIAHITDYCFGDLSVYH